MKVFWYSDYSIDDLSVYAPLILAFDHIVVPSSENDGRFYDHSKLKLPPEVEDKGNVRFYHNSADGLLGTYLSSVDKELHEIDFGHEFIKAQIEDKLQLEDQYELFIATAGYNDGILVGTNKITRSAFDIFKDSIQHLSTRENVDFNIIKAILSIAGVDIALSNMIPKDIDYILKIKEKYIEELHDYQSYISELLGGTWDLIKSDLTFDEVVKWARFTANTKIDPSLRRVEAAIRKGDKNLLAGIGLDLVTRTPSLAANVISGNSMNIINESLLYVLNVFAPKLAQSLHERRMLAASFGISYLYRLRKAMTTRT